MAKKKKKPTKSENTKGKDSVTEQWPISSSLALFSLVVACWQSGAIAYTTALVVLLLTFCLILSPVFSWGVRSSHTNTVSEGKLPIKWMKFPNNYHATLTL